MVPTPSRSARTASTEVSAARLQGLLANFAIALRNCAVIHRQCIVYLTSVRCRFVADRVIRDGLAGHAADREAASAEVAAVGSRRRAAHHRDTGRLQTPQRPPRDLDHRYVATFCGHL